MKKMTKKEMFAMVMEVVANSNVENKDEMEKFIAREIELLEKKKSKSGQSKKEKDNAILKEEILAELVEIDKPVTVSDFQAVTRFVPPEFSNQKISAMLNQLVKEGKVKKEIIKKKSYFSVA
jgi:uncharacterized protein (DUF2344 family)